MNKRCGDGGVGREIDGMSYTLAIVNIIVIRASKGGDLLTE